MNTWWNETALPFLGAAWPAVTGAYSQNELVRHAVTCAVGVLLGWVFL